MIDRTLFTQRISTEFGFNQAFFSNADAWKHFEVLCQNGDKSNPFYMEDGRFAIAPKAPDEFIDFTPVFPNVAAEWQIELNHLTKTMPIAEVTGFGVIPLIDTPEAEYTVKFLAYVNQTEFPSLNSSELLSGASITVAEEGTQTMEYPFPVQYFGKYVIVESDGRQKDDYLAYVRYKLHSPCFIKTLRTGDVFYPRLGGGYKLAKVALWGNKEQNSVSGLGYDGLTYNVGVKGTDGQFSQNLFTSSIDLSARSATAVPDCADKYLYTFYDRWYNPTIFNAPSGLTRDTFSVGLGLYFEPV